MTKSADPELMVRTVATALLAIAAAAMFQPAKSAPASRESNLSTISAMVQASEDQREWTDSDRVIAQTVAKEAGDEWTSCLKQSEDRLRRSSEAVETVATAIFGSCTAEEQLYRRAFAASLRGVAEPIQRTAAAEKLVGDLRVTRREEIISQLVGERLPSAKPKK